MKTVDQREDIYATFADFYDHIVPYRQRKDVDFFVEHARQARGAVLELGCGTGRVLIPIACAGVEIVGLDRSKAMLDICREKLSREPEQVRASVQLVEGELTSFQLERLFSLITVPFRPFQHLTEVGDQLACLSQVHAHLEDTGRFVLDLFNPDMARLTDERQLEELVVEPEFEMPDGRRVIRKHKTHARDYARQLLHMEFIHEITHSDGSAESISQEFEMRYFFRYEVEHLLARVGFEVEALYSDYEENPPGATYPGELLFVARKR